MAIRRDFHRELLTTADTAALTWCRFTVGATGAVGTLKQCASNSIESITRLGAGSYRVQFAEPRPAVIADVKVQLHRAAVTDAVRVVDYDAATYDNTTGQLLLFVSSVEDVTAGAAASGTITCVAKASLDDNDNITIPDGFNAPVVYEFDTAGDGVTAGRVQVNVSTDTTADEVANRLKTAIQANQPLLTVTGPSSGVLTLTHDILGTVGNNTITEDVTNAGFLVTGLSGGTNFAVNAQAAADPVQNSELHMQFVELRVEMFDR